MLNRHKLLFPSLLGKGGGDPISSALSAYLRAEDLWDSTRFWALTGGSVTGYGGLNEAALSLGGGYDLQTGGAWVKSTAEFSADLTGLQSQAALTVITSTSRAHEGEADNGINDYRASFGDSGANQRLGVFSGNTSALTGETVGIIHEPVASSRLGATGADWSQGLLMTEALQFSTAGTKLWIDGSPVTIDRESGTTAGADSSPNATGYTDDDNLWLFNRFGTSSSNGMLGVAQYALATFGNLTDAQHLAISAILRGQLPASTKRVVMWGDSLTETKHLGYTDSAATVRITPPACRILAAHGVTAVGQGVSGQTAAQIRTRAVASSAYDDHIQVIWAGTNDEDDTDEEGVVDEIAAIIADKGHSRYVVVTPLIKASWTGTQKANVSAIRDEIISRYPSNYLDTWALPNTTSGTPDTGYLRYQSAATEDDLHPNDNWYAGYVADLRSFLAGKGWL